MKSTKSKIGIESEIGVERKIAHELGYCLAAYYIRIVENELGGGE